MGMSNMSPGEYNRFAQSIKFVLKWEGGYVNDPSDPGGETKYGISKRAHPSEDIKNLTPERATEIYYDEYWAPSQAATVPYPECVAIFDTAVNNGLGKVREWWNMRPLDVDAFIASRTAFYVQLVKQKPADQKYLKGWLARISDLKKLIETEKATRLNSPEQFVIYQGQGLQSAGPLQTLFQTLLPKSN